MGTHRVSNVASKNRRTSGFITIFRGRNKKTTSFRKQPPHVKARRILILSTIFAVITIVWQLVVAPYLLRLPDDFSYEASVVSRDNFYNEQLAGFDGTTISDTKFSYRVTGKNNGTLEVNNFFDVRTTAGDKIFAVERTYGIDQQSQMHVSGRGDRERTGYLFGPPNSPKRDFTYWHVNYDEPATMKFQNEEDILGLTTHHYAADFRADQTKDLKHLPGVGVTRGVDLDVNLQLWIEPETGYLVKYEDNTTAYYYDLSSGKRLNPWNQFSNSYSFGSVTSQVKKAEDGVKRKTFIATTIPVLLTIITVALLAFWVILLHRRKDGRMRMFSVSSIAGSLVVVTGVIVVIGWLTNTPLLTRLSPSFAAMHIVVAINFIIVGVILWLIVRTPGMRLKIFIRFLLGTILVLSVLIFLRHVVGIDFGMDALASLGFTPLAAISPVTALCFILIITVLLMTLQPIGRIGSGIAQVFLIIILLCVIFTTLSYAFRLEYLYAISWFRSMALHTAILFIILVVGILASHPSWRIVRLVRRSNRSLLLSFGVLLLLLTLTGFSWQQSITSVEKQTNIQFQGDASDLHKTIQTELSSYIKAMQGARGLFAASNEVDRNEWRAYVDGLRLPQNYPGMQGMGFVQSLSAEQKAAHIAKVRREGNPSYTIYPEGVRQEYSSVVYVEPFNERNQRALGYDMLSDSTRRTAMERARDTGEPSLSGKVTLVQETDTDRQAGLIIYLPIYRQQAPINSIEQRKAALVGYVYTPIRVADFMRATIGEQTFGLNIGIFDTKTPTALSVEDRLYVVNPQYGIENKSYHPGFVRVDTLPVAGYSLTLRYSSLPTYDTGTAQTLPTYVLFIGVLFSVLLAVLTFLLSSSRNRALKLANAMTIDLRNERNTALTNQHKNEAILSSIGDGVFVIDPEEKIIMFNRAAEAISGFLYNEAVGQPYKKILAFHNEKDGSIVESFITMALSGKKAEMARNTMLRRKDGTVLPVADSAAPIVNARGDLQGAVVVFRDTTQERQLEHMKDEFLSVASHELRTPMGAIRANISMILSGDYGPVNKELIEPLTDMKSSTVRLVELVTDLLNVARIEAGRMKFILSDFDIYDPLQSTVASLVPLGKEKGIKITLDSATNLLVQADVDKIKQIVINLVGNSLKFTDKGSITISTSLQKNVVEVAVSDTGIGISPRDQEKLFGKFKQITSVQDGKPPGTGLGLYISREMIRKMGGELWIKHAEMGKGSVFAFTVPCSNTSDAKRVKQRIEHEANMHPDQK